MPLTRVDCCFRYPLTKLDLVAVSDLGPGANGNMGLITFRASELLLDWDSNRFSLNQSQYSNVSASAWEQQEVVLRLCHQVTLIRESGQLTAILGYVAGGAAMARLIGHTGLVD